MAFTCYYSGVIQYRANLVIQEGFKRSVSNDDDSVEHLIDEINEFVAGSIIKGDTSLFFIEKYNKKNV